MKKFCVFVAVVMALVATFAVSSSAFESELYSVESTVVTYEVVNETTNGGNEDGTGGLITDDVGTLREPTDDGNGGGDNENDDDEGGDDEGEGGDNAEADGGEGGDNAEADGGEGINEDGDSVVQNRGGGELTRGGGTTGGDNGNSTEPQVVNEPEIAYGRFVLSIPSTITVGETGWVTADMRFPAERVFTVSVAGFESDGTIRLYNTDGTGEFISVYLLNEGGAQYSNSYNMIGQWFYYDRGLCINFTPVLASDTTKVSNGTYSGTIQFNVSTYVMG